MTKLLTRILILFAAAGLFLAATVAAIELFKGSPFWSRHHSIAVAYLGTVLVLVSLTYSLRKHGFVIIGPLSSWFKGHMSIGAAGLLLVLAHGRFEFQALVPGLSSAAMVTVGLTGLFGWYMYMSNVQNLLSRIKSLEEAEEFVLAKMASSAFRAWRFVHILATGVALFFTVVHAISLVVFRAQY